MTRGGLRAKRHGAGANLDWVQPPSQWAAVVLRASLGLAGTLLTALSLWTITPPPL